MFFLHYAYNIDINTCRNKRQCKTAYLFNLLASEQLWRNKKLQKKLSLFLYFGKCFKTGTYFLSKSVSLLHTHLRGFFHYHSPNPGKASLGGVHSYSYVNSDFYARTRSEKCHFLKRGHIASKLLFSSIIHVFAHTRSRKCHF